MVLAMIRFSFSRKFRKPSPNLRQKRRRATVIVARHSGSSCDGFPPARLPTGRWERSGRAVVGGHATFPNDFAPTCLKDGGHYFTGERQLFRGAVPPISDSAGASGGDEGDGRQTRPARLPHAALRNEICKPRSRVL